MQSSEWAKIYPTAESSLTVPASLEHLALLRSWVRVVAARDITSVDLLHDLVLAVDEAATTLMAHAVASTDLFCTVDTAPADQFRAILAAVTSTPIDGSAASFGWFVMQTLAHHVVLDQRYDCVSDLWTVSITLSTARRASSSKMNDCT